MLKFFKDQSIRRKSEPRGLSDYFLIWKYTLCNLTTTVWKYMTDPVQNLQLRNEGLDLAHVVGVLLPRGTERVLVQEQLRDVLTPLQDTLQQQQYITMFVF